MSYYICITDKGGRNGTCPDMQYHKAQQHLIKSEEQLTNIEVCELLTKIAKTRMAPKIVGSWVDSDPEGATGLPELLEYNKLNLSS